MSKVNQDIFGQAALVGSSVYNPSSLTSYGASSGWQPVDTTNMVCPIVVGPGGTILVVLSAWCRPTGTVTSGSLAGLWGVDVGGDGLTPLAQAVVGQIQNGVSMAASMKTVMLVVSGLSPGGQTLRWLHAYATTSGASITSPVFNTFAGQSSSYTPTLHAPAAINVFAIG